EKQQRSRAANFGGPTFPRMLLTPFRRGHAEGFFKHRVEKAEASVAAVHGHLNNLGVGFDEQLARNEQTQFGLLAAPRDAEMEEQEAAEVTRAAAAELGQLCGRMAKDFLVGHLLDESAESLQSAPTLRGWKLGLIQIVGEQSHGQTEDFAALQKAVRGDRR